MKFVWEADDITGTNDQIGAAGTIVTVAGEGQAEYWMIGIRPAAGEQPDRYCLISLRDGSIDNPMPAEELAEYLTRTNRRPVAERSTIETYVRGGRTGLLSI